MFCFTAISLKHLLNLFFFSIYKVHPVLETSRLGWPPAGPAAVRLNRLQIAFLLVLRGELSVLTADSAEENGESDEAGNAGDEEQAPEASEGEPAYVLFVELHRALLH